MGPGRPRKPGAGSCGVLAGPHESEPRASCGFGSAIACLGSSEYLPEHAELYDLPDRFAPELARLPGQVMGTFHRAMQAEQHLSLFPAELPAQLSMHETKEEDLADESPSRREFVGAVKKYPELGRHWINCARTGGRRR